MDLFSNPRMKQATSVNSPGEVSAFSMGQYADTAVVSATPLDIGKINKILITCNITYEKCPPQALEIELRTNLGNQK